jgi:hypothetical protein
LGGLTVLLTAIKGNLNSCVAIAPAANISAMIQGFSGYDISQLPLPVMGFTNFTDAAFLRNLTVIGQPRPRNVLLIAGIGDNSVRVPYVRDLFYDYTGSTSSQYFTLYGSFSTGSAIEMDTFIVPDHGAEQYPYLTPEITIAAINWTEQALGLTTGDSNISIPSNVSYLQKSHELGSILEGKIFWFFIGCLYLLAVCATIVQFGEIPSDVQDISSIKVEHHRVRHLISVLYNFLQATEYRLFFAASLILTILASIITIPPATSFIIVQICLSFIIPISIGVVGGVITVYIQNRHLKKFRDNSFDAQQVQITNRPQKNQLTTPRRIVAYGIGFTVGIVLALFFTDFAQRLSNLIYQENWLKPLPVISSVYWTIFLFVVLCLLIESSFSSLIVRFTHKVSHQVFLAIVFIPASIFFFALLIGFIGPFSALIYVFSAFGILVPFVFALVCALLFLFFEILNIPFRLAFKNGAVGTLMGSIILAWIMVSTIIAV